MANVGRKPGSDPVVAPAAPPAPAEVAAPVPAAPVAEAVATPVARPPAPSSFGGTAPVNTMPVGTASAPVNVAPYDPISGGSSTAAGIPAYKLPASLAGVVKSADEGLKLDVLNSSFAPLKSVIGPHKKPSDIYNGNTMVPTREIIGGVIKSLGPQGAALMGVLDTLPEGSVITTPAHKYNVDGKPGVRVVGYGGTIGHANIDKLVNALGAEGARVIKQMTHFNGPAQGGKASSVLEDGVGGTTHAGGFSSGFVDGKPTTAKSDWPSDYGKLDDSHDDYNAALFAVDYQGGVKKQIPLETKLAYKHNADMWDAALGAVVPFAGSDPDPRFGNYKYNPLDLYNQESAASIAKSAATLDWSEFKKKHGAFYCAEGQYTVANLGPQEATLLQKSKFGDTKFGKLIDGFAQAPGYAGKDAEFRKTHPDIGWKHLRDSGAITPEMYTRLEQTDRTAIALEWVPESVKGWQAYEPIEKNGLAATPMTVAGMAWALLSRYMPREAVSAKLSEEIQAGFKKGTPEQKEQIKALLGGNAPDTAAGAAALASLSFKAATGFTSGVLANPEFKASLFKQAGVAEMLEPTAEEKEQGYVGQAAIDDLFNRFIKGFQSATTQKELDTNLTKLDEEMRTLKVIRSGANSANPRENSIKGLMLYSAPPAYSSWGQKEALSGGTSVFKYVATAMHADQVK